MAQNDPIDAVITWVDGADPVHAAKRALYHDPSAHADAVSPTRFCGLGELRYAVRSLFRFAPFLRRIHIVTDDQHPTLLAEEMVAHEDRIVVVSHREIYAEHADLLPVFSSRSIETMLHRIPGLAERFLYLNDDMAIGRAMTADDYFLDGQPILRGEVQRFRGSLVEQLQAIVRGTRPGYAAAQRLAARLAGRRRDYLLLQHQPNPMRRKTLAAFFADDVMALRTQAGYRFRSAAQVSPLGLAAHLELADGARIMPPLDVGYVRPGRPTGDGLRELMTRLQNDAFASLCVQSLDLMSQADRAVVFAGLDARYG